MVVEKIKNGIPLYVLNDAIKFDRKIYQVFGLQLGRPIRFKSVLYFIAFAIISAIWYNLPVVGLLINWIPYVIILMICIGLSWLISDVGTEGRQPVSFFRSFVRYHMHKSKKVTFYRNREVPMPTQYEISKYLTLKSERFKKSEKNLNRFAFSDFAPTTEEMPTLTVLRGDENDYLFIEKEDESKSNIKQTIGTSTNQRSKENNNPPKANKTSQENMDTSQRPSHVSHGEDIYTVNDDTVGKTEMIQKPYNNSENEMIKNQSHPESQTSPKVEQASQVESRTSHVNRNPKIENPSKQEIKGSNNNDTPVYTVNEKTPQTTSPKASQSTSQSTSQNVSQKSVAERISSPVNGDISFVGDGKTRNESLSHEGSRRDVPTSDRGIENSQSTYGTSQSASQSTSHEASQSTSQVTSHETSQVASQKVTENTSINNGFEKETAQYATHQNQEYPKESHATGNDRMNGQTQGVPIAHEDSKYDAQYERFEQYHNRNHFESTKPFAEQYKEQNQPHNHMEGNQGNQQPHNHMWNNPAYMGYPPMQPMWQQMYPVYAPPMQPMWQPQMYPVYAPPMQPMWQPQMYPVYAPPMQPMQPMQPQVNPMWNPSMQPQVNPMGYPPYNQMGQPQMNPMGNQQQSERNDSSSVPPFNEPNANLNHGGVHPSQQQSNQEGQPKQQKKKDEDVSETEDKRKKEVFKFFILPILCLIVLGIVILTVYHFLPSGDTTAKNDENSDFDYIVHEEKGKNDNELEETNGKDDSNLWEYDNDELKSDSDKVEDVSTDDLTNKDADTSQKDADISSKVNSNDESNVSSDRSEVKNGNFTNGSSDNSATSHPSLTTSSSQIVNNDVKVAKQPTNVSGNSSLSKSKSENRPNNNRNISNSNVSRPTSKVETKTTTTITTTTTSKQVAQSQSVSESNNSKPKPLENKELGGEAEQTEQTETVSPNEINKEGQFTSIEEAWSYIDNQMLSQFEKNGFVDWKINENYLILDEAKKYSVTLYGVEWLNYLVNEDTSKLDVVDIINFTHDLGKYGKVFNDGRLYRSMVAVNRNLDSGHIGEMSKRGYTHHNVRKVRIFDGTYRYTVDFYQIKPQSPIGNTGVVVYSKDEALSWVENNYPKWFEKGYATWTIKTLYENPKESIYTVDFR